ncbi:MAG: tail-specific protease [Planctomycetes bacterium RBG_16_64_10]|nr:MAG: tail-specific protease [Planctomycetes bacterium RBG_16_64_10]
MNRCSLLALRLTRSRLRLGLPLVAAAGVIVAFCQPGSQAEPHGLSGADRQIVRMVSGLMERQHLSRRALDDEISQRTLDTFLKGLDPMKVYFYQADIDQFMAYRNEIDNMLKEQADISLAHQIFQRFLQRVDEHTQVIESLLQEKHDFSLAEDIVVDRDSLTYPKNEAEARERWRKRIKYDLLRQKADDVELDKAIEKVRRRYQSIARQWHQTDDDELLQTYLSSMTTSFDPHSNYMSKDTLENFDISMKLELDGIGASLRYIDGFTVVHKIIPGGAADKDGRLKPEDKIIAVGEGTNGEMVDVVDMKLRDVVELIRGRRGTVVRLEVIPGGQDEQQQTVEITRDRIELKDSEARSEIIQVGTKADGSPLTIGVIDLPSFYMDMSGARPPPKDFKSTTRHVRVLLDDFRQKQVDAVVMDLRGNGGGSLTEAINLTGLFIDAGPVVQVKGLDGRVQPYLDDDPGMAWSGPLVVLIDKFSASASEIFAGAVQDYGRGLVVGDHSTHGKGTVQQLFDLGKALFRNPNAPNYGALKMTIQQFYRPSGDSTQNRGVVADIELPSLTTHWDVGEADLDYAMQFDQVPPAEHPRYDMAAPSLIAYLKNRSQQRTSQSEQFQKELHKIHRYQERKERKTVTLNETEFLRERAEFNQDKEEEEQLDELANPDRQVVKRDHYFEEAVAITRDYVDQLQRSRVVRTETPPLSVP